MIMLQPFVISVRSHQHQVAPQLHKGKQYISQKDAIKLPVIWKTQLPLVASVSHQHLFLTIFKANMRKFCCLEATSKNTNLVKRSDFQIIKRTYTCIYVMVI